MKRTRLRRLQRAGEFTLTALFWAAWLYLIAPLLSLLLWLAGIELFRDVMIVHGGYQALLEELVRYTLVVLVMLAVVLLWVGWNLRHYGEHNKRTHQPPPVSEAELAAFAGLEEADVRRLQTARVAVVTFDEHDRLQLRGLPEA